MRVTFILGVMVCAVAVAQAQESFTVSTLDTHVGVRVTQGGIVVSSLKGSGGADWVSAGPLPLALISQVQSGEKQLAVVWTFAGLQAGKDGSRQLRFTCEQPALELLSIWAGSDGPGPVEHRIEIVNRGNEAVLLPVQESLAFAMQAPAGHDIEQWWVDKGAGTPTADGTHHRLVKAGESTLVRCWPSGRDQPRDAIPWTSIQDVQGRAGWYAGIEYTARTRFAIEAGNDGLMRVRMGLLPDDQAPFFTRLAPGEKFEAPAVFIGCYAGDVDDGANSLRKWVRTHLTPPTRDERYPLMVNNSWGSGMAVDERLARKMIDESAELGLEMFHIDAGWFRTVGDWRPSPGKFPNGLGPVADYAHAKGLKFGLWVGWTQGGDQVDPSGEHRIMSIYDPAMVDWFCEDRGKNWKAGDFSGTTACLGDPQVVEWCLKTLRPLIKEAKLDLLEHDQTMVLDGCMRRTHLHTRSRLDAGYRSGQGYYKVYDTLRAENPDLLFENCVNGGHMVDYGAVRRCHYISITDTYDPLSNRRAFYDASYALPPAMCECYIAQVQVHSIANFRFMLRSGMMGWCTIMTDTSRWSAQQHDAAKAEFALYKSTLRPLIQKANLYHISERPDGVRWDGIEYFDPQSGKGAVFAFRGKNDQRQHTFVLKRLDAAARYALSFQDGSGTAAVVSGAELMGQGLMVTLPEAESSEIVHLKRL